VGAVNGVLIAHAGMPAFVVTLGTLAGTRSLATVLSDNTKIHDLGPGYGLRLWIGGGTRSASPRCRRRRRG